MPKFAMEFRVVEIHAYQVEANSLEEAEMRVYDAVADTHLRANETPEHLVCRLLREKKKKKKTL